MVTTATPDVTLTTVLDSLISLHSKLRSIGAAQDNLQETLDELVTKVDEINLPTGEGFSTTYES